MVPFDRFTVVLDACVMFPMLARDVLLTLAAHGFFNPKWSPRIREEWMRNLTEKRCQKDADADTDVDSCAKVEKIANAADRAFPDALVSDQTPESDALSPVDRKDRHVVMTAIVAQADAIVTFNTKDFAPDHLRERLEIEVIHPDDFIMDLVDLNEKRAVGAFRELRARKKNPPWDKPELIRGLREAGLVQASLWAAGEDVTALI
jgi:hypothetical protein